MRKAVIDRRTTETSIGLTLNLDGRGRYDVRTGIRFLDHMLELLARHGAFDLTLRAEGDLDVDQHHTVEDVGIALGDAVSQALGSRRGINRAGYFVMPMDETLAVVAIDLGGRVHSAVDLKLRVGWIGDLQAELVADFFDGFAQAARANVHAKVLYGRSSHHHVEAVFKAFARALRVACARDRRLARMLPSTKGLIAPAARARRRRKVGRRPTAERVRAGVGPRERQEAPAARARRRRGVGRRPTAERVRAGVGPRERRKK